MKDRRSRDWHAHMLVPALYLVNHEASQGENYSLKSAQDASTNLGYYSSLHLTRSTMHFHLLSPPALQEARDFEVHVC